MDWESSHPVRVRLSRECINQFCSKTKLKQFKVQTEFADLKEIDGSNPLYTPAEYDARAAHGRGLNIWRFELFLQYLRKNRDRWDHVMLVDSNDVVFQRDPFEELQKKTEGESNHLRSNDLHFFAERMSYGTILTKAAREQDPQNYWKVDQSWLYACYGEEFIKRSLVSLFSPPSSQDSWWKRKREKAKEEKRVEEC